MLRILLVLLAASALVSCRSVEKSVSAPVESSDLTQEEAAARKARVSNVRYDLTLRVGEGEKSYLGQNVIRFDLSDIGSPLAIDFYEGAVTKLRVNGADVPPDAAKRRYRIVIPMASLRVGANVVDIQFSADYSRQGAGLHRFKDPETNEVFLFSDFEPFDANRMFPCFDQPDLRATLKLNVTAPKSWTVIANTDVSKTAPVGAAMKSWTFPETPPISTYIFAMHAGPYRVWKDSYSDVPLRIYARPAMAKYVRAAEMFKITKQGFKFFEDFFGSKYPFKKYDQLFVPEFNSGAMENVGAVTFNEFYLTRSTPTREMRRRLASTTLHELAHMWFGNLVTMVWWNDLWLNESFATFMATLAMAEATEYKEAWQHFFVGPKDSAYWEDSLVTTHPISTPVPNVKTAFANFDGITYGKGASALKQLRYYIGPEEFRKGVAAYMQKHAYGNATLADFMASLQAASSRDLSGWADVWLRQSGTDTIAATWACDGERLKQIKVRVRPSAGAKFRPQTVAIGLYGTDTRGGIYRWESLRMDLTGIDNVIDGDWKCPQFVYPNDEDYGFAIVSLDPASLKFARDNLSAMGDKLLKALLWNDLWEMVRTGEMPLKDYVAAVDRHMPYEFDQMILEEIHDTVAGGRFAVIEYWPPSTERMAFIARMEEAYFSRMIKAKAGSDDQKFWFDAYVGLARTPEALAKLEKWSSAKNVVPGFELDQDRRWGVVRQLARFRGAAMTDKIAELKKKDGSDRGVRNALAAEAIQPLAEIKKKWMETITAPKPALSLAESRAVMGAMFPIEQAPLAREFDDKFYSYVRANAKAENEMYLRTFARSLSPVSCDPERAQKMRTFIKDVGGTLGPSVVKSLRVSLQEDERCQLVRAKSGL